MMMRTQSDKAFYRFAQFLRGFLEGVRNFLTIVKVSDFIRPHLIIGGMFLLMLDPVFDKMLHLL